MQLFIGSFLVFGLTTLALAIGILFRGQPMHAGCRGLPDNAGCKSDTACGGVCRRIN